MKGRVVVFAALLAGVWLVALSLVVKTSVDALAPPPWGNAIGDELSVEVAGTTQVGQVFTAPLPGLYRIEVSFVSAGDEPGQPVTFHLQSGLGAAEDLWSATLDSRQVAGATVYGFEFEPLRDSQGRTFYFYLESPGTPPGRALQVAYGPDSVLQGAGAWLNGQPIAGNLKFQSYYTLRTRDKIDYLLGQMAAGRPYFLGTRGFYLALAAVYGLLVTLLVWHVAGAAHARVERE